MDIISKQRFLTYALDKENELLFEDALENGADLLCKCYAVNSNRPPIDKLTKTIHRESFKKLLDAFLPYLKDGGPRLYNVFLDKVYESCYKFVRYQKYESKSLLVKNMHYLLTILTREKVKSLDSILFDLLCKFKSLCRVNHELSEENLLELVYLFISENGSTKWNYIGHRSMTSMHIICSIPLQKPQNILKLALQKGDDIYACDIFGQTPLHIACSWKNVEMVTTIVKLVPELSSKPDLFGWLPCCLAIKGTRFFKPLQMHMTKREVPTDCKELLHPLFLLNHSLLSSEEIDVMLLPLLKRHIEECNYCLGGVVSSRKVFNKHLKENYSFMSHFVLKESEIYKQHRKDSNVFIKSVLSSPYIGPIDFTIPYSKCIYDEIILLFQRIETYINNVDPLFACSVSIAGSVVEGTKIKAPDEFDINFHLIHFPIDNPIFTSNNEIIFNLAPEKLTEKEMKYTSVTIKGQITWDPEQIKKRLLNLVKNAMSFKETWDGLHFYWKSFGFASLECPYLVWTGKDVYAEMPISLDIMPVFKITFWPANVLEANQLTNTYSKDCYLIIKNDEFIITASSLELSIMQSLPKEVKYAYIVCKILMELLLYAPILEKLDEYFIKQMIPSSYEMKNAVFKIYNESFHKMQTHPQGREMKSVEELDNNDFETIKEISLKILEGIDQKSYKSTGRGEALFDKSCRDSILQFESYKCKRFLLSESYAMNIRVGRTNSLDLRCNLLGLLQ